MRVSDAVSSYFQNECGGDASRDIAVAVSGGADSLALCVALAQSVPADVRIHALTVDHGLRAESAAEAAGVGRVLAAYSNISHHVLTWAHGADAPQSRVQEEARFARYDLMFSHMRDHGVRDVFLGHHRDDQAETVLFRLAKGSGVKGLAGMARMSMRGDMRLHRPLLSVSKSDLRDFCAAQGLGYIADPSNENDVFARVRLRQAYDVLAAEGLTTERLAVLATRMGRVDDALAFYVAQAWDESVVFKDSNRVVLNCNALCAHPVEVSTRLILKVISTMRAADGDTYGARLQRVEDLVDDLYAASQARGQGQVFRKRTLAGLIFAHDERAAQFIITREHVTSA